MRKTFTQLLVLIACFTGLQAQNTPELLYYKFDEVGTSVTNYASTPPAGTNTATIMGAQSQGGNSICDGVLSAAGTSSTTDYVNTGWITNLSGTSWTLSFRSNNVVQSTSTYYILGDLNAGGFRCFSGGVAGSGNWILRGGFTDVLVTGGAAVGPAMTTFVYDMSAGYIYAYLNGVLINSVAQAGPTISGPGPFKVGAYSSSACLNGQMDEFRLYSRALTPSEVAQLYNPFTPSGFLGADSSFCQGDSLELNLNWPTSSVLWSTGETSDSIWVDTTNTYIVDISGACGVGSDTILIDVTPIPALGFLGADVTVCPGDSVLLTVGMQGDSVLWSTGDTTSSIYINTPGSYSVDFYSPCGIVVSDTMYFGNYVDSIAPGFLGSDVTICTTDSVMFMSGAAPGDAVLWSTGDTTDNIWVFSPGAYTATITTTCNTHMDTVVVNASALVYSNFLMADTTAACVGDSIMLSSNAPYDTYLWTGGSTNSTLAVYTGGAYVLDVADACGSGSDTVNVAAFTALPVAGFTHTTTLFTCDFTNTSTGGGTLTYAWDFGDGNNSVLASPSHTYGANGTYLVTLTTYNECDSSMASDSCVINVLGIEQGLDFSVTVYPNPANNEVFVVGDLPSAKEMKISVLNQMGQEISILNLGSQSGMLNQRISLDGFSSGYYFLRIEANERQLLTPLVVRKQ